MDYITPRRHMGAHYILVHECAGEEIRFFDPYDDGYHSLSVEELREATSPSEESIQYEGWVAIYRDNLNDSSGKLVSLLDCIQQRIFRCRDTLENLKEFKSRDISLVSRLAMKIAFQGILQSDFYQANGYKENVAFYRKHRMACSAFLTWGLVKYYRAMAAIYSWLYAKRFPISSRQWELFLSLYRVGLKFELLDYLRIHTLIRIRIKANKKFYWR